MLLRCNNGSSDNVTALPVVDLMIDKTVNVSAANVSDLVKYEIVVVNVGPCVATGVNVTEKLSPFVKFVKAEPDVGSYDNLTNIWDIGDLAINAPVKLVLTVQIVANGTVENTVTVTSRENDTNESNNNGSSDKILSNMRLLLLMLVLVLLLVLM